MGPGHLREAYDSGMADGVAGVAQW